MRAWNHLAETYPTPLQRRVLVDNIRAVSVDTFDALVSRATGRIAAEFMSYGCVHCRAIEPVLQQVAGAIAATETVFRVNIAVDQELAARYEIQGTPTLVMFLNGREVGRSEGPSPTMSSVLMAVTQPFERQNDY
jgi:thioredoxin 1